MIFGVKGIFSCGCWYLQGGTSSIAIDINCLFALNLPSGPVELLQVNSIEIEQRTLRARKLKRVLRESMVKKVVMCCWYVGASSAQQETGNLIEENSAIDIRHLSCWAIFKYCWYKSSVKNITFFPGSWDNFSFLVFSSSVLWKLRGIWWIYPFFEAKYWICCTHYTLYFIPQNTLNKYYEIW